MVIIWRCRLDFVGLPPRDGRLLAVSQISTHTICKRTPHSYGSSFNDVTIQYLIHISPTNVGCLWVNVPYCTTCGKLLSLINHYYSTCRSRVTYHKHVRHVYHINCIGFRHFTRRRMGNTADTFYLTVNVLPTLACIQTSEHIYCIFLVLVTRVFQKHPFPRPNTVNPYQVSWVYESKHKVVQDYVCNYNWGECCAYESLLYTSSQISDFLCYSKRIQWQMWQFLVLRDVL